MDTREKIISLEQAVELARRMQVRWVTGAFDPLLIEHAQHLQQLVEPDHLLIVLVTNPAKSLLSHRARAELVAGLSIVSHVVIKDGPEPSSDSDEMRITENFIQRVLLKSRVS